MPLFAAETKGQSLVVDGKATFAEPAGIDVATFWKTLYAEGLAGKERYKGDAFADSKAAMAIVGPWAIAVYKGKVDWGSVPVPTKAGIPAAETWTFSDAKNVGLYTACQNQGTAWEVLKFATSEEQDSALLDQDRADAAAQGRADRLRRLLHQEPGVQDIRRPGRAGDRGAGRPQHGRDAADPPGRLHQGRDHRRR